MNIEAIGKAFEKAHRLREAADSLVDSVRESHVTYGVCSCCGARCDIWSGVPLHHLPNCIVSALRDMAEKVAVDAVREYGQAGGAA